ncbi:MAG: ribonuclease HII [Gammaproteobacteria bacterium]|nr:ribonuclease HII [Gammaproteobacteria bacterium]
MKTVGDTSGIVHSSLVAGVDEAGRGPLAGPVVAAAVILDARKPISGLADSKTLTPERREILAATIKQRALGWGLGRVEVEDIDKINILQASLLAMQRAVEAMSVVADLVLVDGNHAPPMAYNVLTVRKGDARVAAIAAASILAKVARDAEMRTLDRYFPGYGFSRHKGYPTPLHLLALKVFGISPVHRKSFAPVRQLLTRSPYPLPQGEGT